MSLDDFDAPLSTMELQVMKWVEEALDLRYGAAGDEKGSIRGAHPETIEETTDLLLRVRTRSDRVDELLAKATIARGRAARAKDEAAFVADAKLMKEMTKAAGKRVDFSSGREREAEAKTASFEERRNAHQADRLVSVTRDAYEVISQQHWSLDAIRKDLRAQLHALQFESSLER